MKNFYEKYLEETFKETKVCAIIILEEMKAEFKSFLFKSTNGTEDGSLSSDRLKETNNAEVLNIIDQIALVLKKVYELTHSDFENIIEFETTRRMIFFEICNLKLLKNIPDEIQNSSKSTKPLYRRTLDKIWKNEEVPISQEFLYLKRGNLTLPLGKDNKCVPVNEKNLLSIIAYTLNSNEYHQDILQKTSTIKNINIIESEMLNCNENHYVYSFSSYTDENFVELSKTKEILGLYGDLISFNVKIFYPKQFQILRETIIGSHFNFIQGLSLSEQKRKQLGKSKAIFCKSYDDLYILKILDKDEFFMFLDLAPHYFLHFCNTEFHTMPSIMVRTLGCFFIETRNHSKNKIKAK